MLLLSSLAANFKVLNLFVRATRGDHYPGYRVPGAGAGCRCRLPVPVRVLAWVSDDATGFADDDDETTRLHS
jgi:hypothetical protein